MSPNIGAKRMFVIIGLCIIILGGVYLYFFTNLLGTDTGSDFNSNDENLEDEDTTFVDQSKMNENLLAPSNFEYQGAFRLPYIDGEINWAWGGTAWTFNPIGDPTSSDDYPGSLYGLGHAYTMYSSEISIPMPVDSRNLADLPTATTLQPFTNIRTGTAQTMFENADIRYAGLAYLPPQASQSTDKIYSCWGAHYHEEAQNLPTHQWCDLDLANIAGTWRIGTTSTELYGTNDYMCEFPAAWADQTSSTTGKYLLTGRFREGGWGGQGPSLYAIAPWEEGNPPVNGTQLTHTRLLGYSSTAEDGFDFRGDHTMDNYHHSDEWVGAELTTLANKSSLIFVGTKGTGDCWYGFSDGTVYPTDGSTFTGTVPSYPHDNRGYWSTDFQAQLLFYDPADVVKVANGEMKIYEPQPYAALDIDEFLYNIDKVNHPAFPDVRNRNRLGGCAYDRDNGIFYIVEYRGESAGGEWNDDQPIIYVFQLTI